jgi:hypothetical protein
MLKDKLEKLLSEYIKGDDFGISGKVVAPPYELRDKILNFIVENKPISNNDILDNIENKANEIENEADRIQDLIKELKREK